MISQTILRIVLILCFSIVLNVRNVHTQLLDFFNFDENNLRTLRQQVLPYSSGLIASNHKDHVDETNWHRVLNILQGQIKQWSFIESQLLEPNANIGIPEITIPLKHLSSTLEILGNILYTRDDLIGAMACLEKACPLMELLPISSQEDNFPANCFHKLRDVYLRLYDNMNTGGDNTDDHVSAILSNSRKERRRKRRNRREVWEDELSDDEELDDEYDESDTDIVRVRNSYKFDIRNSLSYDILKDLNLIGDSHSHRDSHTINSFDSEKRIEELRLPYDHLRLEVDQLNHVQHDSDNNNQRNFDSIIDNEYDEDTLDNLLDNEGLNNYNDNDNMDSSRDELSDEDSEKILHLLDIIVKKFVSEDDEGKREVFSQVESTVNNSLSKNLPTKSLDIGKVLLDVMAQVMAEVVDNHLYSFKDELDQMLDLHGIDRDDITDEKMLSHLSLEERSRLRVLSLFERASKDVNSDNMSDDYDVRSHDDNSEGDDDDDGTSDGINNNSHQSKRDVRRKNNYRNKHGDGDEPVSRFDPSSLMDVDPLNTDFRGAVPNINGDSAVLYVTFVILIVLTVAVLLIYQDMQRKKYARLRGRSPKKSQDFSTIVNDIVHFMWTFGCLITSIAKEAHTLVNNSSNPNVVMRNPTNTNSSSSSGNDNNNIIGTTSSNCSNNSSKKNKNANDDLANLLASVSVGNKYEKKISKSSKTNSKNKNGAKSGVKVPAKSDENKYTGYDDSDDENDDDDEDAILLASKLNAKDEANGNQVDRQSVVSFNLMSTTNVDDVSGDFTLVKKEPKAQVYDKAAAEAAPHRVKLDSKGGQVSAKDKTDLSAKKNTKVGAALASAGSPQLLVPSKSILKQSFPAAPLLELPVSTQQSASVLFPSNTARATPSPNVLPSSVTGVATIPLHLNASAISALPAAASKVKGTISAPALPPRFDVTEDNGASTLAYQAAVNSLVGLGSSNGMMRGLGNASAPRPVFDDASSLLNLGSNGVMDNWFSSKASQQSNQSASSNIFGEATFPSLNTSFMHTASESSAFGETKSSFNAQAPLLPELSAHAPSFQPNTLQFNSPYGGFAGLFGSAGTGGAASQSRNPSVMQSPSELAFQLGQSNVAPAIASIGMGGGSPLTSFGLFPSVPPGLSRKSNVRSISLAVYCNFLVPSQVKAVKVTTNVAEGEFLLMKRSIGNSELWSISLEVNRTKEYLVYKFFVEDADRNVWEEQVQGHRRINLTVVEDVLTQEDIFSNPCKLKTM